MQKSISLNDRTKLLLMTIPFLIIVFAFSYVPLFGWVYAFVNFKPGIPLAQSPFVGFDYFTLLFTEGKGDLIRVLMNTFIFSFLMLILAPLPVILAILITEVKSTRFQKFIQTTTTLPNFVSWIIVFSLAFSMFSNDGVVNQVLMRLNLIDAPLKVLGNSDIVYSFQTTIHIWKIIGWNAIIYIAAIAGIDGELHDAAKVDGCGRFRSIIHITLPGISSTFFVLLLLQISNILSVGFDQYFVFYNALVSEKIEVLDYYVFKIGIRNNDYSFATAIGIMKTVVSIVLLFSVNYLSKKVRGQGIV